MGVNENGRLDEDDSDLRTGEKPERDESRIGEDLRTGAMVDYLELTARGERPCGDPAFWFQAAANRLRALDPEG